MINYIFPAKPNVLKVVNLKTDKLIILRFASDRELKRVANKYAEKELGAYYHTKKPWRFIFETETCQRYRFDHAAQTKVLVN